MALVLCGFLHACDTSDPRSSTTQEVDSAGTRIIIGEREGTAWPVASDMILGGEPGDERAEFFRVAGGAFLPNGTIAVVNAGTAEVRLYDRDGAYRSAVGRKGQGPGEFRFPNGVWPVVGDSIAVWDGGLQRLSFFDGEGHFGRSYSPANMINPSPVTVTLSGWAVFRDDHFDFSSPPGSGVSFSEYYLLDASGGVADQLPRQPLGEFGRFGPDGMMGLRLFGGVTAATGGQEEYWIGTTERDEIRSYSLAGRLQSIVRWPGEDRRVTPGEVELAKSLALSEAPAADRDRLEAQFRNRPTNDLFPSHSRIIVDRAGLLWIERYRRPSESADPRRWDILDHDGRFVGFVHVNAATRILDADLSSVLALVRSPLDEEAVVILSLKRPGS
jgi:hypothetical protein